VTEAQGRLNNPKNRELRQHSRYPQLRSPQHGARNGLLNSFKRDLENKSRLELNVGALASHPPQG